MLVQSWMSFIILKLTTFSLGCYAALRAMKIGSSNPSMGNRWKFSCPFIRLTSLCSSGQARKKEMSFHCLSGGTSRKMDCASAKTPRDQIVKVNSSRFPVNICPITVGTSCSEIRVLFLDERRIRSDSVVSE
jgi:hypothetical protein